MKRPHIVHFAPVGLPVATVFFAVLILMVGAGLLHAPALACNPPLLGDDNDGPFRYMVLLHGDSPETNGCDNMLMTYGETAESAVVLSTALRDLIDGQAKVTAISRGQDQMTVGREHGVFYLIHGYDSSGVYQSAALPGGDLEAEGEDFRGDAWATTATYSDDDETLSDKWVEENDAVLPASEQTFGLTGLNTGSVTNDPPSRPHGLDIIDPEFIGDIYGADNRLYFTIDRPWNGFDTTHILYIEEDQNGDVTVDIYRDFSNLLHPNEDVIDALSIDIDHSREIDQQEVILFSLARDSLSLQQNEETSPADLFVNYIINPNGGSKMMRRRIKDAVGNGIQRGADGLVGGASTVDPDLAPRLELEKQYNSGNLVALEVYNKGSDFWGMVYYGPTLPPGGGSSGPSPSQPGGGILDDRKDEMPTPPLGAGDYLLAHVARSIDGEVVDGGDHLVISRPPGSIDTDAKVISDVSGDDITWYWDEPAAGESWEVSLDHTAFVPVALSPGVLSKFTLDDAAPGSHTVAIRRVDSAGAKSPPLFNSVWIPSTLEPPASVSATHMPNGTTTGTQQVSLVVELSGQDGIVYSIDGGPEVSVSASGSSTVVETFNVTGFGIYRISTRATSVAGDVSAPVTRWAHVLPAASGVVINSASLPSGSVGGIAATDAEFIGLVGGTVYEIDRGTLQAASAASQPPGTLTGVTEDNSGDLVWVGRDAAGWGVIQLSDSNYNVLSTNPLTGYAMLMSPGDVTLLSDGTIVVADNTYPNIPQYRLVQANGTQEPQRRVATNPWLEQSPVAAVGQDLLIAHDGMIYRMKLDGTIVACIQPEPPLPGTIEAIAYVPGSAEEHSHLAVVTSDNGANAIHVVSALWVRADSDPQRLPGAVRWDHPGGSFGPGITEFTIVASGGGTVENLRVQVDDLLHDSHHRLSLRLTKAGGSTIVLDGFTSRSDKYFSGVYSDLNSSDEEDHRGTRASEEDLSAFDGEQVSGTWVLTIENLSSTPGTLAGWSALIRSQVEQRKVARGDVDHNGISDASDVVYLSYYLTLEWPALGCVEAYDVDGNGTLDLQDLSLLNSLQALGPFYPSCVHQDSQPLEDEIGCAYSSCP